MARPTDEENTPLLSPTIHSNDDDDGDDIDDNPQTGPLHSLKARIARFLADKVGHYCVHALVSLDFASIFAAPHCTTPRVRREHLYRPILRAENVLDAVSLVLSCLFVIELGARVSVSGRACSSSWFNCLDAAVIVPGLAVGVLLGDVLGDFAPLAVVVRLLRVFRIIEEVSTGAEEQMVSLQKQIAFLSRENEGLRQRVMYLRVK